MPRLIAVAVILVALFLPENVRAGDDDYIWCSLTDSVHSTKYFSGVFLGDYSHSVRYENAFHDYVHATYDNVIGTANCFFERDPKASRAEKTSFMARARGIYKNMIDTDWTY